MCCLCCSVSDVLLVQFSKWCAACWQGLLDQWLRCGCAYHRATGQFNVHWCSWCIECYFALQLNFSNQIIGFSNGHFIMYRLCGKGPCHLSMLHMETSCRHVRVAVNMWIQQLTHCCPQVWELG